MAERRFLSAAESRVLDTHAKGIPIPLAYPSAVGAQEKETDKELKKEIGRGHPDRPIQIFTPPTAEEVATYCRERKNTIDAQRFVDHYTSNGWRVGRTAMRNWKAAVRTWEKNQFGAAKDQPKGMTPEEIAAHVAKCQADMKRIHGE